MKALLNFLPSENRVEIKRLLVTAVFLKSVTFLATLLVIFCVFLYGIQFLLNQEISRIHTEQQIIQDQSKVSGGVDVEAAIKSLNKQTSRIDSIQNTHIYWTLVLKHIDAILPDDITITDISIQSDSRTGTLSGIAATRDAYYELDKNLQSSQFIEKADLPISLLKSDIQFSISITFAPDFFSHET